MTRTPLLTLSVVLLGALPVAGQATKKPDISQQLIGTWEGPYQSEAVPPGNLRLVVSKEKQEWKVTLEVVSDQPLAAGEVQNFAIEDGTISWSQMVTDMECKSTATLVAGLLKGLAECSQGGVVALTATFLLEKKTAGK